MTDDDDIPRPALRAGETPDEAVARLVREIDQIRDDAARTHRLSASVLAVVWIAMAVFGATLLDHPIVRGLSFVAALLGAAFFALAQRRFVDDDRLPPSTREYIRRIRATIAELQASADDAR